MFISCLHNKVGSVPNKVGFLHPQVQGFSRFITKGEGAHFEIYKKGALSLTIMGIGNGKPQYREGTEGADEGT